MENAKLSKIVEGLVNKADYGDQNCTNSTFETTHSLPSVTVNDGRFCLKKSPASIPLDLGASLDCSLLFGRPEKGSSRVFFEGDYSNSPKAPNCQSHDGIKPSVTAPVSASCKTCPKAKFGSGKDGKGTACKPGKTLFIVAIREDEQFLAILRISGKALANLQGYVEGFTELDVAVDKFITTLTIDQKTQYPVIEFSVKEVFEKDDFEALKEYIELALDSIQ